jgi:uncharacterized membrane protein
VATVKNITVSVDDHIYRKARICAAERNTSVSALVADFLRSLGESRAEFDRLRRLQQEVTAEIESFSAEDRLDREGLHGRAVR